MRLSIIPTTWLTILALASVLMSGFASGSTMISNMKEQNTQVDTSLSNSCSNEQMPSHAHSSMLSTSQPESDQCVNDHDMSKSCCDTTCTNVMAVLISPISLVSTTSQLVLFESPQSGDVIYRTQTLYRPPSA